MKPCVVLVALLAAGAARAADDPATAAMRAHFASGVRAYDLRQYDRALDEFRAAYAAKPVPAIQRNVALTLERLDRPAEALDALEQFVADGGAALAPDVREAARSEMRDLDARVATVRVSVAAHGGAALPAVRLTLDGLPIDVERAARGLHLAPGAHVLHAHAEGAGDGDARRELAAGEHRDISIEVAPAHARLSVRTNVADADVAIDGAVVRRGSWSGVLTAGEHRVQVSAPGFEPIVSVVELAPDEDRELPVTFASPVGRAALAASVAAPLPPEPPPYELTTAPALPEPARSHFLEIGLGLQGESLTPAPALGADGSTKKAVGEGALALALGAMLSRRFGIAFVSSLAGGQLTFDQSDGTQAHATISNALLAVEARFRSGGRRIRLVAGAGAGADVVWVTNAPAAGSGLGPAIFADGGLEIVLPRAYVSGAVTWVLHDVSPVRGESAQHAQLFGDSFTSRAGLRAAIGYPF